MPDRVIRDEILESDRWLDLPTDTARLCYMGLLLRCDDFGNFEAGPRRLFRFFVRFAQVKNEADADILIMQLADADLIRRYEVDGRELFHLPRFKPSRDYLVRLVPESPWDDKSAVIGKHKRILNKGISANVSKDSAHVSKMLGLGVGVGVGSIKSVVPPVDNFTPVDNSLTWAQHWTAKGKAFGIEAKHGESEGDYCRRVQEFAKARV